MTLSPCDLDYLSGRLLHVSLSLTRGKRVFLVGLKRSDLNFCPLHVAVKQSSLPKPPLPCLLSFSCVSIPWRQGICLWIDTVASTTLPVPIPSLSDSARVKQRLDPGHSFLCTRWVRWNTAETTPAIAAPQTASLASNREDRKPDPRLTAVLPAGPGLLPPLD